MLNIDYTPPPTGELFMMSDARMRVLMGPVGCLAGDTEVLTEFGPTPISDIDRPMRVLSWDERQGRFRLVPATCAFPKGRDYLYRVTTLQGEFVAAGFHRVYGADGNYRRVDTLAPGQSLSRCSVLLRGITSALSLLELPEGVRRCLERPVSSLERYAASARQYGQQLLRALGSGPGSALALTGVPLSVGSYDGCGSTPICGLQGPLQVRSRQFLYDAQTQIGDYVDQVAHLHQGEGDCGASLPSLHSVGRGQLWRQSLRRVAFRLIEKLFSLCSRSWLCSLSSGTILSVERLAVKQAYWDLQVPGTNNYVIADGTIHHNSGKSVTSSFEVIRRASMQAPNKDGVRKTRAAVVRETARQLADTTIKTFLDWFPPGQCGVYMRTTKTYFFKVGDVECEVMFRALDDADDVANLNSLELTFTWFNECRDIHPDIIDAMSKRVGRFPSKKDGGPTWYGMWGDTNPPTLDTWWYYQMEHINPEDGVSENSNGWDVFKQPSGRSKFPENIENLVEGYYDIQGRSEEYIRVYIDGEYGLSSAGQPVYKYFRPDVHMASGRLAPILNGLRPITIGMDLGLTPAAVIGQLDARGRALILADCVSFDMGVQRFMRTMLKPLLYERFAGANITVVVDPAGVRRAETDERSAIDIIKAEGFKVMPAKTNNPTARVSAVDDFLMRSADGDSAFVVDPRCVALKSAMMGGYRFHPRTGAIEKNKHSHVAEALQYLMLHIASISGGNTLPTRREVRTISAQGWT